MTEDEARKALEKERKTWRTARAAIVPWDCEGGYALLVPVDGDPNLYGLITDADFSYEAFDHIGRVTIVHREGIEVPEAPPLHTPEQLVEMERRRRVLDRRRANGTILLHDRELDTDEFQAQVDAARREDKVLTVSNSRLDIDRLIDARNTTIDLIYCIIRSSVFPWLDNSGPDAGGGTWSGCYTRDVTKKTEAGAAL